MNVYLFAQMSELLSFLDQVWHQAAIKLPVYAVSDKNYAVKVDDVKGVAGLEQSIQPYSSARATLPDNASPLSWLDLLTRLRPQPWTRERPFSAELLVVLIGKRGDFEKLRDHLFEVERGSAPPFLFEAALLEQTEAPAPQPRRVARQTWLLHLCGLHAYAPLVDWLADDKKYEVYYPYLLQAEPQPLDRSVHPDRITPLYVQWGYELPPYQVLASALPPEQLVLMRAKSPWRHFAARPTLHPILHVSEVSLSGPAKLLPVQAKPLSDSPAFQLRLRLRPRLDTTRDFEQTEAYLLERISTLQFQLERLRLEQEDLAPEIRLYVYEEEGRSLDALREFILRLPIAQRSRCSYARFAVQHQGATRIFHAVLPVESLEETLDVRARLRPDYEFYLNRELTQVARCKIYLPVQDGRRLELFPPLLAGNGVEADRMRAPLLGADLAKQAQFQPRDLLILWPDDDTIVRLFLRADQQVSLDEAYAALNTLLVTRRAQVIDHALPTVVKQFDQTLGLVRQDFARIEQAVNVELQTAWRAKLAEIDQMLNGLQPILKEAAEVDDLAEGIKSLARSIRTLQVENLDDWYTFVGKVCAMHQAVMAVTPSAQQRSIAALDAVRRDVQQTAQEQEREITETLARIQNTIEDLRFGERLPDVARQLRALADKIK